MGEIIRQTMYVDKPYQSRVFDLVHTINNDGTEQRFDFNKVVPEPAEFPPVPATASDFEHSYHTPQSYWRRHNWGCSMNACDAKYRVNTDINSPQSGVIGLQFMTKNGSPWYVFLMLSHMFPEATFLVEYLYEAGNELAWESEEFKGGYMVKNIKDWQDFEKYDRIMKGQPLDKDMKEELAKFPVEGAE
jgi:hypothetical protein